MSEVATTCRSPSKVIAKTAALDFSPNSDATLLLRSGKIEEFTNYLTTALRAAVGILTKTRNELISSALADDDAIITVSEVLQTALGDLDTFKQILSDAEARVLVAGAAAAMTRPRARKTRSH